jgi:hypothetical protein
VLEASLPTSPQESKCQIEEEMVVKVKGTKTTNALVPKRETRKEVVAKIFVKEACREMTLTKAS